MRWILFCALILAACSNDKTATPQVTDDGIPRLADFTGDEQPTAIVPDGVAIEDIELPLEQVGEDTGQDGILYSAMLGGYYLMRVQLPTGRFNYEYDLGDDIFSDEDSIHRQAGSAITQSYLIRVTGRDEFRVSARRALDYLFSQTEEDATGNLNLPPNLGSNALLAIAASVYTLNTDDDEYADEVVRLGDKLLTYLDEEGQFSGGDWLFLAQGQALMALEHVHAATGDDKYLDALELAGQWLVANPEEHEYGVFMGLWADEPLTYLYSLRADQEFADLVFVIADKLVAVQHPPGSADDASWDGGYRLNAENLAPVWNTCLKLEAVVDAYRMAVLSGDEERQAIYAQSSKWAVGYLMRLQQRKGETDDHPDPALLVGAVPFIFGGHKHRVDVTHHMAQSILKTSEYLQLESFPGARDPKDVSP